MIKRLLLSLLMITMAASLALAFFDFSDVRQPSVAGKFYPGTETALALQVDQFLNQAGEPRVKGTLIALIVPHAGYEYSGRVAAEAYKELKGRRFKRVILLGPSHHLSFDGISIGRFDDYRTPLGKVMVDRDFADKIIKAEDRIQFRRDAHLNEHSIEVQLPFLQRTLGEDFQIVPIVFGNASFKNSQLLAITLSQLIDEDTLIVCSTDWSHYHDYQTALSLDQATINAVGEGDVMAFARLLDSGSGEACGASAVITTMLLTPSLGANKIELLKYANSGDLLLGDKSKVVGYAAIAYSYENQPLDQVEKQKLLEIARQTLIAHLSGKELPEFMVERGVLTEKRGVFVTLTNRGGLRGCIGYFYPVKPLAAAVQDRAIAAATKDSRFSPVTEAELPEIKIEISVLSRLKKIESFGEIEVGRDGLLIVREGKAGLLLPQVASDNKWTREQFLMSVCHKAGLPLSAWQEEDTELYRFSAEVFHE